MPPPFNQGGSGPPFNPLSPSETLLLTQLSGIQQGVNLGNPPGAEYTPVGWAGGVEGEGTGFSELANFLMNGLDMSPPQSTPGGDPYTTEPYIYQKIIDSKLNQPGIDPVWESLFESSPQVKDMDGKPCPDDDTIKSAWASVMALINEEIPKIQNALGGCNQQMDDMFNCLNDLPFINFSKSKSIKIVCDNTIHVGNKDGHGSWDPNTNTLSLDITYIFALPTTSDGLSHNQFLQATILRELAHHCNNSSSAIGGSSELDSKFFETLLYGQNWPIGINSHQGVNLPGVIYRDNSPTLKVICCESQKIMNSLSATDLKDLNSNLALAGVPPTDHIIMSDKIVWDTSDGEAWLRCDDGSLKPLGDYNPFGNQSDGLDWSICKGVDPSKDCHRQH